MKLRRSRWIVAALAGSVGANVLIAAAAAFLMKERGLPQDMTDPVGVRLVELTPPEPPEPEEVKEPQKPQEQQQLDFIPDLVQPDLGSGGAVEAGISVNLGGIAAPEADNQYVFEAYELDQAPVPIVQVPPAYPFKARERAIEGVVQVKMLINADGTVGQIQILDARPKGVFEDAVRAALPQWRFSPGKIQGKPVTAWVVVPVRFSLV
jgi:protein TonB